MLQLASTLWIGNALEARDSKLLFADGFAAVMDVAYEEPPAVLPRELLYLRVPLLDGEGNDPARAKLAIDTAVMLLQAGLKTLLACSAGMSRSPTVAAFAVAKCQTETEARSPEDVVQQLAEKKALEIKPALWETFIAATRE